jgi:hypothetical protein
MLASEQAQGWLSDPAKMAELAQRLYERRPQPHEWDALFLSEKAVWEDLARRVVRRTIEVAQARERLSLEAEDLLAHFEAPTD